VSSLAGCCQAEKGSADARKVPALSGAPTRTAGLLRPGAELVLVGAALAFVGGASVARSGRVSAIEQRVFRAVNGLPSSLHVPVWTVMQLGSLAGALTVAAAAGLVDRSLGLRLAASGATTWAAAKVLKRFVRRGRPHATVEEARVLGRAQSGLGYPSGHAAVAATLAVVVLPHIDPACRPPVVAAALLVGPARLYVGAHLPLDVLGGVAFGVAVGIVSRA
jgi:undecaprenyl-diphosphatase